MGVQHAATRRCMNEFMCRLLFVMQEESHLFIFLASRGSGRPDCEGGGECMIWLVCEVCGKVFHRNRAVMYGNGSEVCPACTISTKKNDTCS